MVIFADVETNDVEIEAGVAEIRGLADGTYYLEETKAPEGYNKLIDDEIIQNLLKKGFEYDNVKEALERRN